MCKLGSDLVRTVDVTKAVLTPTFVLIASAFVVTMWLLLSPVLLLASLVDERRFLKGSWCTSVMGAPLSEFNKNSVLASFEGGLTPFSLQLPLTRVPGII